MVLRNLPPVNPFVVRWQFPRFLREDTLDPARLKKISGRPPRHNAEDLLECLGDQRLKSMEWERLTKEELGITHGRFFELLKELQKAGKVQKSVVYSKWQQIRANS